MELVTTEQTLELLDDKGVRKMLGLKPESRLPAGLRGFRMNGERVFARASVVAWVNAKIEKANAPKPRKAA